MIRMTLMSFLGHFVAFVVLIFLSWFQPIPKIRRPTRVNVRVIERTPPPATPRETQRVIQRTPPPKTPRLEKTIARPEKTPTPTKTRKPKTPKPTKTPRAKTPKPRTPTPTRTPPPRTPTPTRKPPEPTRPAVVTPDRGQSVALQRSLLADYEYYYLAVQQKIASNFTIPRHLRAKGITCRMRITILRDGRIVNIQMVKSTGDGILDGYARRALEVTAKLPPLPDTLRVDHIQQDVLFDYTPNE